MKLVIIDYGVGNLLSIYNAFQYLGVCALVSSDPQELKGADRVVLPGVGAFADGMKGLRDKNFIDSLHTFVDSGRPFLGICLGMQLLMARGYEFGEHEGLNIIPGETVSLRKREGMDPHFKVPHIGWNQLRGLRPWRNTILNQLPDGSEMYFVHSFYAVPKDPGHQLAIASYAGASFCAVIAKDNVYGCQFHPEKSAGGGLKILDNFIKL